jgi:hypothetical protein
MANSNLSKTGTRKADALPLSRVKGRRAAIKMFRDMYGRMNEMCLDPEERAECAGGIAQDNVFLRQIDSLLSMNDRQALIGFCEVLNDYCGSCVNGGAPDPEFYEGRRLTASTGPCTPVPSSDDRALSAVMARA